MHLRPFDGRRLQFDVVPEELWKTWCELQTPIANDSNGDTGYSCVHDWGWTSNAQGCQQINPRTNVAVPIDCGKVRLCTGANVCQCDAQRCTWQNLYGFHFDVVVTPPALGGSALFQGLFGVSMTKD